MSHAYEHDWFTSLRAPWPISGDWVGTYKHLTMSRHESNEQEGMYMVEDQDRQEVRRRSIDAEREELQQATQHFLRSMFRFGICLAFSSVNRLPRGPQRRLQAVGGEITHNLATFMHTLAEDLQEVTPDTNPSPTRGADHHGESE